MRKEKDDRGSDDVGKGRRLLDELAVRWPRTSVLRLHWVLGWTVAANLVAWKAAGWFVGGTMEARDSNSYMQMWWLLAVVMTFAWLYRQWLERPRLPPSRGLTLAWSPGVGSMIVVLMFSPVWTGVRAADVQLRALRAKEDLKGDMAVLGIILDKDNTLPTRRRPTNQGKSRQSGRALRFEGISEYRMTPKDYETSRPKVSARLEPSKEEMSALSRYVPKDRMNEARSCTENIDECAAGWRLVRSLALRNIVAIGRAHTLSDYGAAPYSEEYYGLTAIAATAAILGIMSGYFGVVALGVYVRTAMVLFTLWLVTEPLGMSVESVFHLTPGEVAGGWAKISWSLYVLLVCLLLARLYYKRERNLLHDIGVILLLLLPFFIVGSQSTLNFVQLSIRSRGGLEASLVDRFYVHIACVCGGATLLGFAMTWVLSWYRALPRST